MKKRGAVLNTQKQNKTRNSNLLWSRSIHETSRMHTSSASFVASMNIWTSVWMACFSSSVSPRAIEAASQANILSLDDIVATSLGCRRKKQNTGYRGHSVASCRCELPRLQKKTEHKNTNGELNFSKYSHWRSKSLTGLGTGLGTGLILCTAWHLFPLSRSFLGFLLQILNQVANASTAGGWNSPNRHALMLAVPQVFDPWPPPSPLRFGSGYACRDDSARCVRPRITCGITCGAPVCEKYRCAYRTLLPKVLKVKKILLLTHQPFVLGTFFFIPVLDFCFLIPLHIFFLLSFLSSFPSSVLKIIFQFNKILKVFRLTLFEVFERSYCALHCNILSYAVVKCDMQKQHKALRLPNTHDRVLQNLLCYVIPLFVFHSSSLSNREFYRTLQKTRTMIFEELK